MSTSCLLFLAPEPTAPPHWWRLGEDTRVDAGDGWPAIEADERVLAIAPAAAVTLHWGELPDRSPAQTLAAARVLADEAIAAGAQTHVAIARDVEADGMRAIAVVAPELMTQWIAVLATAGLGDVPLVPAPLLLPLPAEGFLRAELPFEPVLRGRGTALADEPGLAELIVADAAVATIAGEPLDAMLREAAARPPLDLRQGAFARVRRRAIDWLLVRRLGLLLGLVLLTTLAIDLVRLARYSLATSSVEAAADAAARAGLPRGGTAGTGEAAGLLSTRLARLRGPGLGFSRTAAAAFAAVRQVDGARVSALVFQPSGALRLTLSVPSEGAVSAVRSRLEAAGFRVTSGTFQSNAGRLTGDLTMVAP